MRTKGILLAATVAFLFVGTQSALAQRTADMNITVTANNVGVFTCNLADAAFDYGDVDSDGTLSSTGVTGTRNAADDGAYYDATATTWSCRAAPSSTVAIALTSIAADHTVGTMGDDNLQVTIPATNGGTSTGLQDFTSQANLITGMSVGNGPLAAAGDLDMRLHVYDTDPTGANTWVVRLRATGNP